METSNCTEEGYIDIEVNPENYSITFSQEKHQESREFEFQMPSASLKGKESLTSPADELFYRGKLLPLHLPPRLQMVREILLDATDTDTTFDSTSSIWSSNTTTISSTNCTTPLESCNVSPTESCRVSTSETVPGDDCFFEWSSDEINSFIAEDRHQSMKYFWTKKIKKPSLCKKVIKASGAYFLSLFTKSACTESKCNVESETDSSKMCMTLNNINKTNTNPFFETENYARFNRKISTLSKKFQRDRALDGGLSGTGNITQRRSFSGAIQWHSATKCSSSSSSSSSGSASSSFSFRFNKNGFCDLQLLKRSSYVSSEIESSIEGAIAFCKKTQTAF